MIGKPYGMQWSIEWEDHPKTIAILCTKEDHALMEMLWAVVRKDLRCNVSVVVSNHETLRQPTEALGFKYEYGEGLQMPPTKQLGNNLTIPLGFCSAD